MGIPDDIEIATIVLPFAILQVWQLSVSRAMTAKKSAK